MVGVSFGSDPARLAIRSAFPLFCVLIGSFQENQIYSEQINRFVVQYKLINSKNQIAHDISDHWMIYQHWLRFVHFQSLVLEVK